MVKSVSAHLMFEGRAKQALDFYTDVFVEAKINELKLFGDEHPQMAGKVEFARLQLAGISVNLTDSPISHDFSFTPAVSLFIECESEQEITLLANALQQDGEVLMPLDNYGFSRRFTWLNDKFGVSWQLNQAE